MKVGDKIKALVCYSYGINLKIDGIYTIVERDDSRNHVIYITNGPFLHGGVFSVFKKDFEPIHKRVYEIF